MVQTAAELHIHSTHLSLAQPVGDALRVVTLLHTLYRTFRSPRIGYHPNHTGGNLPIRPGQYKTLSTHKSSVKEDTMARLSKSKDLDVDSTVEDIYDQAMADVYDILMEAYDKVGVRVQEMLESTQDIEVELEDDEIEDYLDDDE